MSRSGRQDFRLYSKGPPWGTGVIRSIYNAPDLRRNLFLRNPARDCEFRHSIRKELFKVQLLSWQHTGGRILSTAAVGGQQRLPTYWLSGGRFD